MWLATILNIALVLRIYVVVVQDFRVPDAVALANAPKQDLRNRDSWDVHHDFPRINREIRVIERPVEFFFGNRLIRRIVIRSKVWMSKSLAGADALLRVEHKHLL